MPPEYCEYGPDFETHCTPWLKKNHPGLFRKLHDGKKLSESAGENDGDADGAASAAASAPAVPWTTKERLQAVYKKYMPDKLDGVDAILEKYEGKEDKLFAALKKKYGPEPEDPYYVAYGDASDDEDDAGGAADRMGDLALDDDKKK